MKAKHWQLEHQVDTPGLSRDSHGGSHGVVLGTQAGTVRQLTGTGSLRLYSLSGFLVTVVFQVQVREEPQAAISLVCVCYLQVESDSETPSSETHTLAVFKFTSTLTVLLP